MTAWTDLGDGIHVRLSLAFQMNSVVLLHEQHTVLVDPGVLPSELDDIAARVRAVSPAATTLVFTHAHWDHVLGIPWWPDAATLAHDQFAADLERTMPWVHEEANGLAAKHGEKWAKPFERFKAKERVSGLRFTRLGPWRTVFRDAFGHSPSQLSMHLPEQRVLIAADMLSDIEVPTCNAAPSIYRATLAALEPLVDGGAIETLIPGHGTIARGLGAVREIMARDIAYLDALMRDVRRLRSEGRDLAAIQKALAGMPDVERHPEFSQRENHEENIQLAYQELDVARAGR
jgi:hydroxyacylglutathione hydrolase